MNNLVSAIQKQTEIMFQNADIMLRTCRLGYILCEFPIWKHAYHMLHSCDQWFINPYHYKEPAFHQPDMNSLKVMTNTALSQDDLLAYLVDIRTKITAYLATLTDDMLAQCPPDCAHSRLSLILSQQRHFYAHLGNINATTIIETNEWPRVIGITGKSGTSTEGLFE